MMYRLPIIDTIVVRVAIIRSDLIYIIAWYLRLIIEWGGQEVVWIGGKKFVAVWYWNICYFIYEIYYKDYYID